MTLLLIIWLALLGAVIYLIIRRGGGSGALTLSYFVSLSLIHIPGAMTFLGASPGAEDVSDTILGLELTIIGMAMFVLGVTVAQLIGKGELPRADINSPAYTRWLDRAGLRFVLIGTGVFFVAIPIAVNAPSVTSVLSACVGLLIIGMWMWLYAAAITGVRRRLVATFLVLPLLPIATLALGGFVSFGIQWVLGVLSFFFVVARRRLWIMALTPAFFFFGLSLFVAYLGERTGIRDVVWHEQADLRSRFERIGDIVTRFELLSLANPIHATALEARLNQNSLVGLAVVRQEQGFVDLAYGGTVPWWFFIPRVIWPEKPEVGGGRNVVSHFTGLFFPEPTSVGTGQVLEFYVNFGVPGVLVGFFLWGLLLMTLDRGIMRAMARADLRGLLLRSMPGLTLVSPGGNLLEILIAAIGAIIAAHVVIFVELRLRKSPLEPPPPVMRGLQAERP